jgi:hypothetical protein
MRLLVDVLSASALLMAGACASRVVPTQHRASDAQCAEPAGPGNCTCTGDCPPEQFTCTSDATCGDAGINGRCVNGGGPAGCGCTYDACLTDGDCPANETCACHGSPYTYEADNRCVPGNCRVDSDCGSGGFCSPSVASDCGAGTDYFCLGYYCHTSRDQCTNDTDCGPAEACIYSYQAGFWQCAEYLPPT